MAQDNPCIFVKAVYLQRGKASLCLDRHSHCVSRQADVASSLEVNSGVEDLVHVALEVYSQLWRGQRGIQRGQRCYRNGPNQHHTSGNSIMETTKTA